MSSGAISRSVVNPFRKVWSDMGQKYKLYFDTHEHHGRKNTTYLCLAIYATVGYLFYVNGKRKARKVEAQKAREKPSITKSALARAGLL